MSILIKGMEIPVSCGECLKIGWNYVFECNLDDVEEGEKLITCPLIPVPPHGDLVERDALIKTIRTERNRIAKAYGDDDDFVRSLDKYALSMAVCAPTIIEAEGE